MLKDTQRQFVFYYLASTVDYRNRPVQRQRRSQSYKKTRQTQSKKAEKEWIKDIILLPSPKVKTVLRNLLRETLFDEGFVISRFKFKSSASEKELTSLIKKALSDKMAFTPGSPKFNFVCAIGKRLTNILEIYFL